MLHQPLRSLLRIAFAVLLLAGLSSYAIRHTSAQDPPQPPQPKQKSQKDQAKDQKDKKGEQRQGSQADQQTLDPNSTISINTDEVLLDVMVTDQSNHPVYDLKKDDFAVYEDKVKQEINQVTREEVPVSFGMVIDTSGSMRSKLQQVADAAVLLVKQMREKDEAFISSFKAEPELVQDFTSDRRDLEDALNELYASGGTSLLDAIIATADYAQQKGKQRRKALIIITDGLEKNSSVKEREVLEAVKEDEAQIYFVGFIDDDDNEKGLFGKSPAKKARELLTRLASDSGGRAFFPKEVSEMPAIAEQIAKDLRTQYVVYYTPSNSTKDGTFRSVKVAINPKDNRKLTARTRQGYYARDPKSQQPAANAKKTRSQ